MLCPDLLKKALRKISIETNQPGLLNPEEFTKEDIDLLYKLAYGLYEAGDYLKAKEVFQRLVMANPLEQKFWTGLGASSQMSKNYNEALTAWSLLSLMDDKKALFHFHAAECLFSLKNIQEAKKALNAAKLRLHSDDKSSLAEKISALETAWSKQLSEEPQ
jgi:type III secretion system low calcium response chaperone LcrH/SycD